MKKIFTLALVFVLLVLCISVVSYASDDAMTDIEENLAATYRTGEVTETDDGYLGITVEYSVYSNSNITVKNGYRGTPIIIYVVNTNTERVGTKSDTEIIESMLDRGYVVVVLDYKNNLRAKGQNLDWSLQGMKLRVNSGEMFTDTSFPLGEYYDTYVVPAGYDISINNVFFEIDKHAADGSFEEILNNWNTDLRLARAKTLVKWVHEDGSRKTVADASDGTSPVWYDADGNESETGEYTRIKWTVAEVFTDCVNPDGTPLDLDLYMTLIYPTNPESDVPVMALASSSEYMPNATSNKERPQLIGFAFSGYAAVVYDYMYVPMAREDSYDYYDGGSAATGDSSSYSLQRYSGYELNTAAMRYIRYLSLSDHETYAFNNDKIGVYGNSKGASMRMLGEANLQTPLVGARDSYASDEEWYEAINSAIVALQDRSNFAGHSGETRYDNGKTDTYECDGYVVEGGELQPWLTYNGVEIPSGAQFVYASNGANQFSISEGHAPSVYVCYMEEKNDSAYGSSSTELSLAKNHNVPSLNFEVPLGHTISYGEDLHHGVDTYSAVFDFIGYYLKDDAAKLLWVTPSDDSVGVGVADTITLKFAGSITSDEIVNVVISDSDGNVAKGEWSSQYGNTEWTFTPSEALNGNVEYTVTVPATLKGDNGKALGTKYTSTFTTEEDVITKAQNTVDGAEGQYVTFNIPELTSGMNRYDFRFYVSNEAANVAELYVVTDYNSASPDSSSIGELLGTVNLRGSGLYEIEITDFAGANQGKTVTLLLKEKNAAGEYVSGIKTFESNKDGITKDKTVTHALTTAPDGSSVLSAVVNTNAGKYQGREYYNEGQKALSCTTLIKSTAITPDDIGRKFTISVEIYDTISRTVQLRLSALTSADANIIDYDRVIKTVTTKANEWVTYEIEYVVYDADYGQIGEQKKTFSVYIGNDGATESPIYFRALKATETVTDINASGAVIAMKNDGGIAYKASNADHVFSVLDGDNNEIGGYSTLKEAISAYKDGYTVKMHSNYTIGAADGVSLAKFESFKLDMNGYTVTSSTSGVSLLSLTGSNGISGKTTISVMNGEVLLEKSALALISSGGGEKAYEITLTNLKLGVERGATASELIVDDLGGGAVSVKFVLDSCDINVPDKNIAKAPFEIFSASESESISLSYEVMGGSISVSSEKRVTLSGLKNVTFLPDGNSEYTTFTVPSNVTLKPLSFMRENDCATLEISSSTNGYSTYNLVGNELSTKYGTIPEEYADVEKYPFAVFDSDGNFVMATDTFQGTGGLSGVMNNASGSKDDWFAVLRTDTFEYNEELYSNLSLVKGSVTIDLQGNQMILAEGTNKRLLHALAKSDGTTTIIFTNGKIQVGNNPIIRVSTSSSYNADSPKTFNFNFNDIEFTFAGSAKTMILAESVNGNVNLNVEFSNCKFDLTGAASSFTLFDIDGGNDYLKASVKISGGEITSDSLSGVRISELNANSSMVLAKGKDFAFTTLTVNEGEYAPTENFVTEDGKEAYFGGAVTENGRTTYVLVQVTAELMSPYGRIPEQYESITEHPFLIYDANGNCVASAKAFGNSSVDGFLKTLRNYSSGTYYVYMRDDFEFTGANYDNLALISVNVVLDLGGNVLTNNGNNEKGIFCAYVKSSNNVKITVKNGTIITGSKPVVVHDANVGYSGSFTFNFENLYIDVSGSAAFIACKDPETLAISNITFTDCTVDLRNAPSGFTSFINLSPTGGSSTAKSSIVFNGGEIIASEFSRDTLYVNLGDTNTVKFGKNSEGKYTELLLPQSAALTSEEFVASDANIGALVFYKVSEGDDGVVYSLKSKEVTAVSFVPEANITLDKAVILNVYVPKTDNLERFVFNGTEYTDFSKLDTVIIDGNAYYVLKVEKPITKAFELSVLEAYLTVGEDTDCETFAFSIQKCAELILADSKASDVEKMLVRDMLAYVRSTYRFFGIECPDGIDALIGEGYEDSSQPVIDGEVGESYEGLSDASLVLNSAPVIRFYIEDGYNASDFSFYINSQKIETTIGSNNGQAYVDLHIYAYQICETITYTIAGTEAGSYHIRSYYEFSKTASEELEDLVIRFWKYCQSAKEYNNPVTDKETPEFNGMQSVLLLGQSNMAGRGDISTVDPISDDRIFMMRDFVWVKMEEPIHNDKSSAGVGLAASFAKAFVDTYGCDVGLIPGAFGGTSLADWCVGGEYYERALAMAKAAQSSSEICVILWHQGESDMKNENYAAELQVILDAFIADLGLDPEKIVIITGELGEFRTSSRDKVHNGLKELSTVYKNYGIASADGLTAQDVTTHFDAASLRVFGYRYFEIFHKLMTGETYEFDNDPDNYRKVNDSDVDDSSIITELDFNSTSEGALTNSSTIKGYPKTNGSINIVKLSDNEKYLVMQSGYDSTNSTYTDAYLEIFNTASGSFTLEMKLRLGEGHGSNMEIKLIGTKTIKVLKVDKTGKLIGYSADGTEISLGDYVEQLEWVSVKIELDFETNKKNIYINGVLLQQGADILETANAAYELTNVRLQFVKNTSAGGNIQLDDYVCYKNED